MLDIVVVALGTPILVGVYRDGLLIDTLSSSSMASEALEELFKTLLEHYTIDHLIYAKGPGSFMGIKVSYLFLKTLSIVQKIPLLGVDAFFFNQNHPIKAIGKLYFVKNSSTITLMPLEHPILVPFGLPKRIEYSNFDTDALPMYGIDAVG